MATSSQVWGDGSEQYEVSKVPLRKDALGRSRENVLACSEEREDQLAPVKTLLKYLLCSKAEPQRHGKRNGQN